MRLVCTKEDETLDALDEALSLLDTTKDDEPSTLELIESSVLEVSEELGSLIEVETEALVIVLEVDSIVEDGLETEDKKDDPSEVQLLKIITHGIKW
jgi:hypothetical protein